MKRKPIAARSVVSWPWKVRALQLDLARHMESVDYIRRTIDFAADQGYNMLTLYLEGCVATPIFPYRPKAKSYTLDDMARVVEHARRAGLEVLPMINALGHASQFLSCAPLRHLAEERDGQGRFSANPSLDVFCPSLEGTYSFLETYIRELSAVFPSQHFHVGLDEAFNLGFCRLCRKRWAREGLGGIFTQHVRRLHAIVRGQGKRMWIWDDMLELFPQEVGRLPKDVVLCHWNYATGIDPEGCKAHFLNLWRRDWLKIYEEHGFDVVICPGYYRGRHPRNVETFTDYARRRKVLGGLLTQWEETLRFIAESNAVIAFTGRLWQGSSFNVARAWQEGLRAVWPKASPALHESIQTMIDRDAVWPSSRLRDYLTGPLTTIEILQRDMVRSSLVRFSDLRAREELSHDITLDHLALSARWELLHWELRELLPRIMNPRRLANETAELARRARAWQREFTGCLREAAGIYKRQARDAHPSDQPLARWQKVRSALAPVWARLRRKPGQADWWLVLRLFLQDYHGAPILKVSGLFGRQERILLEGCIKPSNLVIDSEPGGNYTVQVPFTARRAPDAVRIESWGYGGQGVAYVELQNPTRALHSRRLLHVAGPVERPKAVLRDDSAFAMLGRTDILVAIHKPALGKQRSLLEIKMGEFR